MAATLRIRGKAGEIGAVEGVAFKTQYLPQILHSYIRFVLGAENTKWILCWFDLIFLMMP